MHSAPLVTLAPSPSASDFSPRGVRALPNIDGQLTIAYRLPLPITKFAAVVFRNRVAGLWRVRVAALSQDLAVS
jgi:hypothetical protein